MSTRPSRNFALVAAAIVVAAVIIVAGLLAVPGRGVTTTLTSTPTAVTTFTSTVPVTITATSTTYSTSIIVETEASASQGLLSEGYMYIDNGTQSQVFTYVEWNDSTPSSFVIGNVTFTHWIDPSVTDSAGPCWTDIDSYGGYNITFTDGSSVSMSTCSFGLPEGYAPVTLDLSEHTHPQAGLMVIQPTGEVYFLVAGQWLPPDTGIASSAAGYPLECVVTTYDVDAIEVVSTTGSSTVYQYTSTTYSYASTNYTTTTSLSQTPGYTTSSSTTIQGTGTTTGPLIKTWSTTVCTWLP